MRDQLYEETVLQEVIREFPRRYGVENPAYISSVQQRLALGAERYGDDAYLQRDNVREVLEECPDIAAYGLLELQRLNGVDDDSVGAAYHHLFEAMLAGALADYHARQARAVLRER